MTSRPASSDELAPLDENETTTLRLLVASLRWRWHQWATVRAAKWVRFLCLELVVYLLLSVLTFISPRFWHGASSVDPILRPTVSNAYFIGLLGAGFDVAASRIFSDTKESKARELREVSGLPPYLYWVEQWVFFVSRSAGFALILAVVSHFVPVLYTHSNPVLLWLVFILGMQQYTILGFFAGRMGSSQDHLKLFGLITLILAGAAIVSNMVHLSWTVQHLLLLLPLFSPYTTLASIQWLELEGTGLTFAHLFKHCCYSAVKAGGHGEYISAGAGILAMLLTNVWYLLAIYWLDQVIPAFQHGRVRPWLFFLQKGDQPSQPVGLMDSKYGSTGKPSALLLKDVVQVYSVEGSNQTGQGKRVLDRLSLEVYAGEVFALLGHNGAGKSTMMQCIVGTIEPTHGTIKVNGVEVDGDPANSRQQLAFCPQDSVIEEEITVQWHLEFHAALRGIPRAKVEQEVSLAIAISGLEAKRDLPGAELSGGQKRWLCVATAILGARPLLLLDEPSSGMDPASRQELWGAIEKVRDRGSAVLFTTHYLDEADVSSDRKAILSAGRVKAIGTSMELKKSYAVGYELTTEVGSGTQGRELVKLVQQHIPLASLKSGGPHRGPEEGAEGSARVLVFSVPFSEADRFGPLFDDLNLRRQELALNHFGLQMSSLEDVFMRLAPPGMGSSFADGEDTPAEAAPNQEWESSKANQDPESLSYGLHASTTGLTTAPSRNTFFKQVAALIVLRMKVLTHGGSFCFIFTTLVLPVLIIVGLVVNPGATLSPSLWGSFVFGFPMGLMSINGPLSRECTDDIMLGRKLLMFAHGMSRTAYVVANLVVEYVMVLAAVLTLPMFAKIFNTPNLDGPGLPLVIAQAFVFPLHLSIFMRAIQSFVPGRNPASLQFVTKFLGVVVPSMLVWSLLVGATSHWPWKAGMLKWARRLHLIFSATLPSYSLSGVVLFVLFETYSAHMLPPGVNPAVLHAPGVREPMDAAGYFSSIAAAPLYLALGPTILLGLRAIRSDMRVSTTAGVQPGPEEIERRGQQDSHLVEDEGVAAEQKRLAASSTCEDFLAYRGLRFSYLSETNKIVPAVRGVSLGLCKGECFGLLGPNGAGKTTTLACLTGALWPPSAGSIFFEGRDLGVEGFEVLYGKLGLCSQGDEQLWPSITGMDHLLFHARLKGLPEDRLRDVVYASLERVRLKVADAYRETSTYSGGMRRRLSIALAMLGRPCLLFLDEPTAGVDAMAKREIWRVLRERGAEQTLLLTSHQMEEVEAVCDRITLQVLGRLRALGSVSDLRRRYGKGHQLEVFLPSGGEGGAAAVDSIVQLVHERVHTSAELVERRPPRLVFHLAVQGEGTHQLLPTVFREMSKVKNDGVIKDYCLRQPTLEQVFIRFATEQQEGEFATEQQEGEFASA